MESVVRLAMPTIRDACIAMAEGAGRKNVAELHRMAETWLQIAEKLLAKQQIVPNDQNAPSTDKVQ
jgi:hypothetical protein